MSNQQLRSRCRNPRCRLKRAAPTENDHHAFCTRTCHESFYRNRCRVCERDLRKTGKRGDAGRRYCRPPATCKQQAEKWPEKYGDGQFPVFPATKLRSADSTGTRFGIAGHPPTHRCLRDWWWGDPGIGDCSLYDKDGLTIARIVLQDDGRWHLRSPVSIPRMSWPDLDEAKHRSEAIALSALPLDSKTAANVRRYNETPHPMRREFPAQPERPAAAGAAKDGPRDEAEGRERVCNQEELV
jgi:hypothetical protein